MLGIRKRETVINRKRERESQSVCISEKEKETRKKFLFSLFFW